jgi:hypothetical protein
VQRRLPADGEADERRLERKRNQRPDRQPDPLAVERDTDDRDSRRESPHQLAKLIATDHGGEILRRSLATPT